MSESAHEGPGPAARTAGRDRDEQGRARNARPRDGLGRPLPYGAPGVTRQAEGVIRSAGETLDEAQRLLDAGRPFHAHEVFEDRWKSAPEPERELWRGLAQFAVGLTHAARGNAVGSTALLARAAEALAPFAQAAPYGIDVAGLARFAADRADRADRVGGGPGEVSPPAVPRLRRGPAAG